MGSKEKVSKSRARKSFTRIYSDKDTYRMYSSYLIEEQTVTEVCTTSKDKVNPPKVFGLDRV
jgi:hypothetical protein